MGTAVLEFAPGGYDPSDIGTLGAFFEAPPKPDQIKCADERLIRSLVQIVDKNLLSILESRSAREFSQARKIVIPKYLRSIRALTNTVRNLIDEKDFERISEEVVGAISSDFEKSVDIIMSKTLSDQGIFTLWTLGKIREITRKIGIAGAPPKAKRAEYEQLAKEFVQDSIWAQFHLDVLSAAIRWERQIPQDVQDEICNGLRAAVNAYADMKEVLLIVTPKAQETVADSRDWTDEDERLLAMSMRDLNDPEFDRY